MRRRAPRGWGVTRLLGRLNISSPDAKRPVMMLLLVGDRFGANRFTGGRTLSIFDEFTKHGWGIILAGATKRVAPCPWTEKKHAEPIEVDCLVDDIESVSDYDGISILPGPTHKGLIDRHASWSSSGNRLKDLPYSHAGQS